MPVRVCVCVHKGQKTDLAIVPQELSTLSFEVVSHWPGAGTADQAGYAGSARNSCLCLPCNEIISRQNHACSLLKT